MTNKIKIVGSECPCGVLFQHIHTKGLKNPISVFRAVKEGLLKEPKELKKGESFRRGYQQGVKEAKEELIKEIEKIIEKEAGFYYEDANPKREVTAIEIRLLRKGLRKIK